LPWPAEVYSVLGQGDIIENMNLMQAFQVVSTSEIVAVLDSVRNKILNFALELESRNPEAGEAMKETNKKIKNEKKK